MKKEKIITVEFNSRAQSGAYLKTNFKNIKYYRRWIKGNKHYIQYVLI